MTEIIMTWIAAAEEAVVVLGLYLVYCGSINAFGEKLWRKFVDYEKDL